MKISLSSETERRIAEKLSGGRYHSADEVVREGQELLEEREKRHAQPPISPGANLAQAFDEIASQVPAGDWTKLPADLSKNLDHYLYGSQKKS